MNFRSSDAMSLRWCTRRLRRVSAEYNLLHVLDLAALTAFAVGGRIAGSSPLSPGPAWLFEILRCGGSAAYDRGPTDHAGRCHHHPDLESPPSVRDHLLAA